MTDTTDTKALRTLSMQRVKEIANGDSMLMGERVDLANTAIRFHKELDVALDAFKNAATELFSAQEQLEAERQRPAGSEEELHKALHREKAAERKLLAAQDSIGVLEGVIARKDFDSQKGDQVPVGWEVCSPEWCNKHNACHEAPRIWFESEDGTGPHYHPSEYIAPQKLTDLSYDVLFNAIAKSAKPLGEHMSISVKDFKAAIEAAGGIVKDGE